jgi:hypothetical protein
VRVTDWEIKVESGNTLHIYRIMDLAKKNHTTNNIIYIYAHDKLNR